MLMRAVLASQLHRAWRGSAALAVPLLGLWLALAHVGVARAQQAEAAQDNVTTAATATSSAELHKLDLWLEEKKRSQALALPAEARLAHRHGRLAWDAGEEATGVSLMRGAAELDPFFAAPHLALTAWFITREPSQALLSGGSLVQRLRNDFGLQLALLGNLFFGAVHATFIALLVACLFLILLHQHELRHIWRERLGIFLSPASARTWAWAFLALPWALGLGLAMPSLALLGMLWPILRSRERVLTAAFAVMVCAAPLGAFAMGRLILPLSDGAPFYGIHRLEHANATPEAMEDVAALATREPANPFAQFGQAWMARRAGDLATAERAYRRTLELWPNDGRVLNNLGNLLAMQGRFDEALRSFAQATAADPRNAAAFFNASQIHTRLFDYGAASDAVARASALDFELVRTYQTRSGDDLPLIDQWIAPATFWRSMLDAPPATAVPVLPPAWRGMIEPSGWYASGLAALIFLFALGFGFLWQRRMPLRACSNCGQPVCRRCAQRQREQALCATCAVAASRAESPEFGRVLLGQQRRQVDRWRSGIHVAAATLLPGLGLVAHRRLVRAFVVLLAAAALGMATLGVPAPFVIESGFGVELPFWLTTAAWTLVYAMSLAGFLGRPFTTEAPTGRATATGRGSTFAVDSPARAA